MFQSLFYFIYFSLPLATAFFSTDQGESCTLLDSNNSTYQGTCMKTADCSYIQKFPNVNENFYFCKEQYRIRTFERSRLFCCPNLQRAKQGENCLIWGYIGPVDYRYPNVAGRCRTLEECETAKDLLQEKKRKDTCFMNDKLVCCPLKKYSPLQTKADKKCAKYYEVNVGNYLQSVYGGRKARPKEFPHMAAIGYNENNSTTWFCGGSLISEDYVLTAAHCTRFNGGAPNIVRLGDLDLDDVTHGIPIDIGISKIYRHPDYKSSSHYHDIALLKLESKLLLEILRPICLHTKDEIPFELEAAGWGATENSSRSSHLLKVSLNMTDHDVCVTQFSSVSKRKLKNGIINEFQICAGGLGYDTCTGDSGGPLHYKVSGEVLTGHKHFVLAGVTSFGKGCGGVGVYTRVSAYVPWIESIVWPSIIASEKIIENIHLERGVVNQSTPSSKLEYTQMADHKSPMDFINLAPVNTTDQIIHPAPDDNRSGPFYQSEGDSCVLPKTGYYVSKNGTCTSIYKCEAAQELLVQRVTPQLCGFNGNIPIVCCPN